MDEGYIKYQCYWKKEEHSIPALSFNKLNKWRSELYKQGVIGVYENGIGFGNISIKRDKSSFLITGSATGHKQELSVNDYALVTAWDYENNSLWCSGNIKASSESLTHAAVYESNKNINAVVHVHSLKLWDRKINILPTTPAEVTYGTPEMAYSIMDLINGQGNPNSGLFIMGGHEEGVISFGTTLEEACALIINQLTNL